MLAYGRFSLFLDNVGVSFRLSWFLYLAFLSFLGSGYLPWGSLPRRLWTFC